MRRANAIGLMVFTLFMLAVCAIRGQIGLDKSLARTGAAPAGSLQPICSVQTEEQKIALTFNTVHGTEQLSEILDILEDDHVPAAFFLSGEWVQNHPDETLRIREAGHDLGSCGEHYRSMTPLTEEECRAEILDAHERVRELAGVEMTLFRPPYGETDQKVLACARACGYRTVLGSVDSMDWRDYGAEEIIRMILNAPELSSGAILTFRSDAADTPDALRGLIPALRERGYEPVRLSELLAQEE